jgi:hypothetical protein
MFRSLYCFVLFCSNHHVRFRRVFFLLEAASLHHHFVSFQSAHSHFPNPITVGAIFVWEIPGKSKMETQEAAS